MYCCTCYLYVKCTRFQYANGTEKYINKILIYLCVYVYTICMLIYARIQYANGTKKIYV